MKQNENNERQYTADEGKAFVRRADSKYMGRELWLGAQDNIGNYEEVADTRPKEEGAL